MIKITLVATGEVWDQTTRLLPGNILARWEPLDFVAPAELIGTFHMLDNGGFNEDDMCDQSENTPANRSVFIWHEEWRRTRPAGGGWQWPRIQGCRLVSRLGGLSIQQTTCPTCPRNLACDSLSDCCETHCRTRRLRNTLPWETKGCEKLVVGCRLGVATQWIIKSKQWIEIKYLNLKLLSVFTIRSLRRRCV